VDAFVNAVLTSLCPNTCLAGSALGIDVFVGPGAPRRRRRTPARLGTNLPPRFCTVSEPAHRHLVAVSD
jgi:hypothetical protein